MYFGENKNDWMNNVENTINELVEITSHVIIQT